MESRTGTTDLRGGRLLSTPHRESKFTEVNGLNLHYLDWGEQGRPPLVCLHGNTGQAGTWDFFGRRARVRYHVTALDQRGHGNSDWAPEGYEPRLYAADLAGLLDHLGVESASLVGLSLGGLVSMAFASENPGRVERLVLVDIAPEASPAARARMAESRGYPERFDSLEEAVEWARGDYMWALGPGLRDDLAGRLKPTDDGGLTWKADPQVFNPERPRRWARGPQSAWDAFDRIRCPVLLVRGAESDLVSDETVKRMTSANTECRVVDLPGAGHNVVVDKPDEFFEAVSPFLEL